MSRPRTEPVNRLSTNLRIPRDLHDQLAEVARERDVSVNHLVVAAIRDFLPRLIPMDQIVWTLPAGRRENV